VRDKFSAFYTPTHEQFEKLWTEGLIALDANVLLNLYRYRDDTRSRLLRLLRQFESQLWLPYQTGYEFHKNRLGEISHQSRKHEQLQASIQDIESLLDSNRGHPHVSQGCRQKFAEFRNMLSEEAAAAAKWFSNLLADDPILAEVTELFNGRVGDPLPQAELDQLPKEGEDRYKKAIPPGFKDASKSQAE
jgi:hypothetical protein